MCCRFPCVRVNAGGEGWARVVGARRVGLGGGEVLELGIAVDIGGILALEWEKKLVR